MCGCTRNKNRPVVRTVPPQKSRNIVRNVTFTKKNETQITAAGIKTNASGMTKTQRDEERKRRVQMILKRKSQS